MSILNQQLMTRFSYCLPAYLKEALASLAQAEGRNINDLITEALLAQYQQLRVKTGSVIAHFIKPRNP